MERPGSMIRVRPREETRSRTVSIRSLGVGRMSPLHTWVEGVQQVVGNWQQQQQLQPAHCRGMVWPVLPSARCL